MKTFVTLVIALTCFVGRLCGEVSGFLMGSEERVMEHCLKSGNHIHFTITQNTPNGLVGVKPFSIDKTFTNKKDLELYLQSEVRKSSVALLTNNFGQNRDSQFHLFAVYSRYDIDAGQPIDYLVHNSDFSLLKSGAQYILPDFSYVSFGLTFDIAYRVTGLVWARVESTTTSFDSAEGDTQVTDITHKFLFVPTPIAIAGNGTKVSIITSVKGNVKFQTFDSFGNPRQENWPRITLTPYIIPTFANIQIDGGEIGRTYVLQITDQLIGGIWHDVKKFTVKPNISTFSIFTEVGNASFFRFKTVEEVPVYTEQSLNRLQQKGTP